MRSDVPSDPSALSASSASSAPSTPSAATPSTLRRLFDRPAHNPSLRSVRAVVQRPDEAIVDFCVPANPYFPPLELQQAIVTHLSDILTYYPDEADIQQRAVAPLAGVGADQIVVANGSTEVITSLCRELRGPLATPVPTFGRWTDLPRDFGQRLVPLARAPMMAASASDRVVPPLTPSAIVAAVRRHGARALAICNPENPTGQAYDDDEIAWLIRQLGDLDLVVIDESFIDFSTLGGATAAVLAAPNAVLVKSLGKSLGWHGLRLGYAVANRSLAAMLRSRLPWWNINGLAAFVLRWTADHVATLQRSFERVRADRESMSRALATVDGLTAFPSQANFIFCRLHRPGSGRILRDRLLEGHGLLVRECSNKLGGSEDELRLAVLPAPAVERLVAALRAELAA